MFNKLHRNLYLQLLLLILATSGATIAFCSREWMAGVIILPAMLYSVRQLTGIYKRNASKIAFILDAVENSDHTVKFPDASPLSADRLVNQSLNRITHILHQVKLEAIQKEKYYELIMNSVSTGIIVIDEIGVIVQINNEALRLLGLSVLTHCRQLRRVDESLYEILSSIPAGSKQQTTFSNGLHTVHLSVRAAAISLHDNRVRILAINDINRELDEKELDAWIRLTRVLTHEIMNAVTPIASLSSTLLALDDGDTGEIRKGLEIIRATGRSLIAFVNSYRRFTHIPTPSPTLFEVAPFIERIKHLSMSQSQYPSIKIQIDIQPPNLILHADENLITQVLLNVVKNAIEAVGNTRSDGHVQIKALCHADDSITIDISDNGPGIPPEISSQIFIPFFSTKEGGSGIGLSISRQIMRLHGGSLTLNGAACETTFSLRFP
ncbi:MAG: PAS domain-containing protein [Tannerellaceae bacterium]|nr:PAS domain-containing protein [Tannerellaceae bacterium]